MKVAIQGIKGSNHHIVAKHYFEAPISLEECLSFDSLVDALIAGKVILVSWLRKHDCGFYHPQLCVD